MSETKRVGTTPRAKKRGRAKPIEENEGVSEPVEGGPLMQTELENREPVNLPVESVSQEKPAQIQIAPGDEYTTQVYYDKGVKAFIATILEIPEVRTSGPNKETVLEGLRKKLSEHLRDVNRRGDEFPEALFNRKYPDILEVRVSQGLFRKLDLLSKSEKVQLDQLVTELLTFSIERRNESSRPQQRPHSHGQQQQQQRHQQQPRHQQHFNNNRDNRDNRGGRRGGQQQQRYHDTMKSGDNFLEYVRNLEKSGGGAGNWRKK